jgi:hypothetical protein
MVAKAAAIAAISLFFTVTPAVAHHGHNHQGQGHSHDGTPGGTTPAFTAPGHCKHHPHGCGNQGGGGPIQASEPLTLALTGAGLLAASLLRRRK